VLCLKATENRQIFTEVEEMASVVMRFPKERLASFTCSFGAGHVSEFKVFGTAGSITLENAYEYNNRRKLILQNQSGFSTLNFSKTDQFAPELLYFSDCILKDKKIDPSGLEGYADCAVLEAIHKSAVLNKSVQLPLEERDLTPEALPEFIRHISSASIRRRNITANNALHFE
jgi:glucose-fructose oxidoreductase